MKSLTESSSLSQRLCFQLVDLAIDPVVMGSFARSTTDFPKTRPLGLRPELARPRPRRFALDRYMP